MKKSYIKPEILCREKLVMNEAIAGCSVVLVGWQSPYNQVQSVDGAYPTAQAALSAHPSEWGWPIAPVFGVRDNKGAMGYFTDWSNAAYADEQSIIYGENTSSWITIRSEGVVILHFTQYGQDGSGHVYQKPNVYTADEGWWVAYSADKAYLDSLLATHTAQQLLSHS